MPFEVFPSTSQSARRDLYASRTTLRDPQGMSYNFWGLFCDSNLSAGEFIGMYNGMWLSNSDTFPFGNRYTIELSHGMAVAPPGQRPDPRKYPIAMANEPKLHEEANAAMQEVTLGPEHVKDVPRQHRHEPRFYGVAMVACKDIPRGTEIRWHYGPHYSRNYSVGDACIGKLMVHPCDVLGNKLPFDAVSPVLDSPSNSSDEEEDPSYRRRKMWPVEGRLVRLGSLAKRRASRDLKEDSIRSRRGGTVRA